MVFATVENVTHYGGMEYNKIYTLDEMTGYIQHYDKAMEEHIKFINKLLILSFSTIYSPL